jgi:hypothetical protein
VALPGSPSSMTVAGSGVGITDVERHGATTVVVRARLDGANDIPSTDVVLDRDQERAVLQTMEQEQPGR